ncbi:MAG: TIGR04084 family radical SAM/SPASM domain-containing protein [Nitrososphaerota archaeon]|nr:TIGR04084 family radical SAM/SPASM domain-containing protein [Nitrososphaerota archaeon]
MILTKECNLFCTYCGGGSDTHPREVQYSVSELASFLARDPDPVVGFYGGEPTLRVKTMKEMMDTVRARFVLQTNGQLLDRLEPEYLSRLHAILVSVDGTREVTDRERGRGVYDRAMRNVALARERGYRGDVVARMTVEEGTDIEGNVRHLLGTGLFDHVHWQLSFSMFWEAGQDNSPRTAEWISGYNRGVTSLVRWWVEEMSSTGRVHGVVPFLGVTGSLLSGRASGLRCESGTGSFTVMPDGRVSACPVSVDFEFSVAGSIRSGTPEELRGKVALGEPCASCDILEVCGGRCLFVNNSQSLLREGGYAMICSTVRHLVSELQEAAPRVRSLVESGRVGRSAFGYPDITNGCEVIP